MTISKTQREVLEKMRYGNHIYLLAAGYFFFVEGDYQQVEKEMIDQLTDLDLIEYADEMYTITPLGIEALEEEK